MSEKKVIKRGRFKKPSSEMNMHLLEREDVKQLQDEYSLNLETRLIKVSNSIKRTKTFKGLSKILNREDWKQVEGIMRSNIVEFLTSDDVGIRYAATKDFGDYVLPKLSSVKSEGDGNRLTFTLKNMVGGGVEKSITIEGSDRKLLDNLGDMVGSGGEEG